MGCVSLAFLVRGEAFRIELGGRLNMGAMRGETVSIKIGGGEGMNLSLDQSAQAKSVKVILHDCLRPRLQIVRIIRHG